jgi:inosine/xanthosine triphosphate pyrophosphatase family protein/adenylate kinase family enzyme
MLDLYFLTSNLAKFDHISYLLREYAINVKPQTDYGKAYDEPRINDREKLLEASVRDANIRLAKSIKYNADFSKKNSKAALEDIAIEHQNKFFILEDTSVKIHVLSKEKETPGVDVKYWMKQTSFEQLNQQLISLGNDRTVTVRSDIVIYIPPAFRSQKDDSYYKVFTGETVGSITEKEHDFETNPLHPWLDNRTFNKWFVPAGENTPISMLPIEKANTFDFRKKAIDCLIRYLEANAITTISKTARSPFQTSIFDKRNLIICGPTCSGKTILAEFIANQYGHYHIEASDFMHLAYYRKHGFGSNTSIHSFAEEALKENPSIVSEQIIGHLDLLGGVSCVITGFRSPDELKALNLSAREFSHLYVDANANLRYKRSIARARIGHAKSKEQFLENDLKQRNMGIEKIRTKKSFERIKNEGTIDNYFSTVVGKYFFDTPETTFSYDDIYSLLNGCNLSLEEAILIALLIKHQESNDFQTTSEIAKLINSTLSAYRRHNSQPIATHKDNVSRYFNQRLYPYYEVSVPKKVTKFRISTTGISHCLYILKSMVNRK